MQTFFKKGTKQLGFHLTFKTTDLQDVIYITLGDDIKVNFDKLNVPIFFPDAPTQILFGDSNKNSFRLSFDSRSTDRKTVDTQLEYEIDIGSAQNFNSPKYLIVAQRRAVRIGVPNKARNIAVFDNLNVRKHHVAIDDVRYPRDGVIIEYASNDYLGQHEDLKLFQKDFIGEELHNPYISYTDMKNKYPIQVLDLRFQVDHIIPRKIQLFEEYRGATNNARLFMIIIRHRKSKMVSDGDKISQNRTI